MVRGTGASQNVHPLVDFWSATVRGDDSESDGDPGREGRNPERQEGRKRGNTRQPSKSTLVAQEKQTENTGAALPVERWNDCGPGIENR